jgi:hypothetical protein
VRKTRKSKFIVAAVTLAILALGIIAARHVLGNPPPIFDTPDNGVDIAVLSSDPRVGMGISVDVTPESWTIFIIPVSLTRGTLPKKLTAALIVSQDWYLRGVDEYKQSIDEGSSHHGFLNLPLRRSYRFQSPIRFRSHRSSRWRREIPTSEPITAPPSGFQASVGPPPRASTHETICAARGSYTMGLSTPRERFGTVLIKATGRPRPKLPST